ncbi:MAG TPA: TetR family transcriptional regulator [Marmoricola sp.]|nr:TetR family transcriptional regulator [Marmoricola sp.]HNI69923.1 TetR family transcriptional regulator [Marmoricola sp.]HNN47362.1 TetR family transcriptional regulator [Marmoricola sp.]HNO40430.1 TetR family transcriptional regulator [Marmoricola sp.]
MARVAANRLPALPTSQLQKERFRRILQSAAVHGAQHGFDGVQMVDIARDAGVAIGTLYRYFPSKAILFAAVMRSQVEQLEQIAELVASPEQPAKAVADLLNEAARRLVATPQLARAMLQSNNLMVSGGLQSLALSVTFSDLLLRVCGLDQPSDHDRVLVRLVEQTWYGILISRLNGFTLPDQAESDTVLACRLLLVELGQVTQTQELDTKHKGAS